MVYSNSFDVLEFYPYPSFVQEKIAVYNEIENLGEKHIMQLFDDLFEIAKSKNDKVYINNKIVMKIRGRRTGTILYIGYKDGVYSIGLSMYTQSSQKIYISD